MLGADTIEEVCAALLKLPEALFDPEKALELQERILEIEQVDVLLREKRVGEIVQHFQNRYSTEAGGEKWKSIWIHLVLLEREVARQSAAEKEEEEEEAEGEEGYGGDGGDDEEGDDDEEGGSEERIVLSLVRGISKSPIFNESLLPAILVWVKGRPGVEPATEQVNLYKVETKKLLRKVKKTGPFFQKWTGMGQVEKAFGWLLGKKAYRWPTLVFVTLLDIVLVVALCVLIILTFSPFRLANRLKSLLGFGD